MNKALRSVLLLLSLLPATLCAQPQPPARIWRVCVSDLAVPPYLNSDPMRPGLVERLLVDAGRQAGMAVLLLRYPLKRCRTMLDADGADSILAAPTPGNLADLLQFPMKDGGFDVSRRVASVNLVWVKRADSPFDWDGRRLRGGESRPAVVGTRISMRVAIEPLQAMGLRVDDTALSTRQLLAKLAAGRIDAAVGLQEEVEIALHEHGQKPLVVLPKAFLTGEFYAVVKGPIAPELREQIETWWTAIGRLRDRPEYQPR